MKFRRKPPVVEVQRWDWKGDEKPPELPGLAFRRRHGPRGEPDLESACVLAPGGPHPIRKGDFWVKDDGKVSVLTPEQFAQRYEAAP